MEELLPSDLKTILHSKRANLYYLEHCRVLVNGGWVEFVTDEGKRSLYWNIPIANTTALLLGSGTSITQAAVRELAKAGVLLGFSGGGGAIRELHRQQHAMDSKAHEADPDQPMALEHSGRESSEDLLSEHDFVHFEGGPLNRWLKQSSPAQKLVQAPILVCTIDHLTPATEGTRGGRQIAPMLRLMTSDLVLDEPDDFGLDDS